MCSLISSQRLLFQEVTAAKRGLIARQGRRNIRARMGIPVAQAAAAYVHRRAHKSNFTDAAAWWLMRDAGSSSGDREDGPNGSSRSNDCVLVVQKGDLTRWSVDGTSDAIVS